MDTSDDSVAGRGGGAYATPPHAGQPVRPGSEPSARPTLSKLIDELRAALGARLYLLELEGKRAAWSAAYMLAFAVGAALLGVTAWLILIGALMFGAISAGVPWLLTVVVAIALHVGAVFLLVRAITSLVDNLSFAATRRTLSRSGRRNLKDGSRA